MQEKSIFLFFCIAHTLYINSMLSLESVDYRGFVKLLTSAKFFYNAGLLEFSLEFFESFFNVLSFFNRYYYHFIYIV